MCPFNRLPLALPESWAPPCRSQRSRGCVCRSLRSRRRTSHCPRRLLCTFGSIRARGIWRWARKASLPLSHGTARTRTQLHRRCERARPSRAADCRARCAPRNSSPRCARKRAPPVPNSSPRSISTRAHTPASVRVCEETEQKSESCAPASICLPSFDGESNINLPTRRSGKADDDGSNISPPTPCRSKRPPRPKPNTERYLVRYFSLGYAWLRF